MRFFDRCMVRRVWLSAVVALVVLPGIAAAQVATTTATKFVVFASPFAIAGMQTPVEVQALDAQNRFVRTFNGAADVTTTDGAAVFTAALVFTNGRTNFTITYNTGGSQSLKVTDTANPAIFGSTTTNVAATGGPSHIAVLFSPLSWAGRTTYGELIARNSTNGVLTSYNGLVTVMSTDTASSHPATIRFHRGVADLRITFKTQGSQTVTVVDTTNAALFGSQTSAVGASH